MKLFRKIWAIYGFMVFTLTILLFAPTLIIFKLIGGKPLRSFIAKSYYYIPRILFYPCLISFKVVGVERLQKDRQYIIVSNHRSYLDIFANPATSPHPFKYLAKDEIRHIPLVGWVASNFCVFVNRSDNLSRSHVINQMKEAIKQGSSILIYPEGTRNKTDRMLLPFFEGAFKLAIESQTSIAVQTLINSDKLNSPHTFLDLYPGKITCIWDDPVETIGLGIDDISALKEKVRKIMEHNLISEGDASG